MTLGVLALNFTKADLAQLEPTHLSKLVITWVTFLLEVLTAVLHILQEQLFPQQLKGRPERLQWDAD
jgi:hypothetical protein